VPERLPLQKLLANLCRQGQSRQQRSICLIKPKPRKLSLRREVG
jgi:hypothetical protein